MEKENIIIRMEEFLQEIILMIKEKVKELYFLSPDYLKRYISNKELRYNRIQIKIKNNENK
jgi:hypothetical protein